MYRILVVLVVAGALSVAYRRFREHRMTAGVFTIWCLLWLAVLVFGLVPTLSQAITFIVGIGRGADMFFFFSILLLLFTNFILLDRIQTIRSEITGLVRELALRELPPAETNPSGETDNAQCDPA